MVLVVTWLDLSGQWHNWESQSVLDWNETFLAAIRLVASAWGVRWELFTCLQTSPATSCCWLPHTKHGNYLTVNRRGLTFTSRESCWVLESQPGWCRRIHSPHHHHRLSRPYRVELYEICFVMKGYLLSLVCRDEFKEYEMKPTQLIRSIVVPVKSFYFSPDKLPPPPLTLAPDTHLPTSAIVWPKFSHFNFPILIKKIF